jgi:hypothetical protein
MMHAISFLYAISLKMMEIHSTRSPRVVWNAPFWVENCSALNPHLLADFSDYHLCKLVANCMKHIDNTYLLKVDLTERLPSLEPTGYSAYASTVHVSGRAPPPDPKMRRLERRHQKIICNREVLEQRPHRSS